MGITACTSRTGPWSASATRERSTHHRAVCIFSWDNTSFCLCAHLKTFPGTSWQRRSKDYTLISRASMCTFHHMVAQVPRCSCERTQRATFPKNWKFRICIKTLIQKLRGKQIKQKLFNFLITAKILLWHIKYGIELISSTQKTGRTFNKWWSKYWDLLPLKICKSELCVICNLLCPVFWWYKNKIRISWLSHIRVVPIPLLEMPPCLCTMWYYIMY